MQIAWRRCRHGMLHGLSSVACTMYSFTRLGECVHGSEVGKYMGMKFACAWARRHTAPHPLLLTLRTHTHTHTGFAMRIAVGFYVAVGIALIACGCVLQNPPKDYAPAMFVVVGSLNLFASLAGFWGSYHKLRVLMVFILFGGFSVILQIAFDISLFTSEGMGGKESAHATCGSSRVCYACRHMQASLGHRQSSIRLCG